MEKKQIKKKKPGRPRNRSRSGRPTVFSKEVIQKLETAFAIGCTDLEACCYADISKSSLYNYQNENPNFLERKERLKQTPVLQARTTLVKNIKLDKDVAKWFLERKLKKEFGTAPLIGDPDDGKIEIIVRKE